MGSLRLTKHKRTSELTGAPPFARIYLAVVITAAVLALGFSVYNTMAMRRYSSQNTHDYVNDLTVQVAGTVSTDQNDLKKILSSEANTVCLLLNDSVEVTTTDAYLQNYLDRACSATHFEYLSLFMGDNNLIAGTLDSEIASKLGLNYEAARQAAESKECVAYVDSGHIVYAVTIYKDGAAYGVLFGGSNSESMKSLVSSQVYRQGTNFSMVNRNGDMLIASDADTFDKLRAKLEDGSAESSEQLAKVKEDLSAGNTDTIEVELDGKEYFYSYTPIEGEDWMMLTLTPADAYSSEYKMYMTRALACTFATAVLFGLLLKFMYERNKRSRVRLSQIAFEDTLTGGSNLPDFEMRYDELRRHPGIENYCVVMLDIKDFKLANEISGTAAGDALLRLVYKHIDAELDKSKNEFACRSEMDHYFVCLREKKREDIQYRINKILENINSYLATTTYNLTCEFTQGACVADSKDTTASEMEDRARIAKNTSNQETLNRCVMYNDTMRKKIVDDRLLDHMAEVSIENHDFVVYFQPKVSMHTGKVRGAEALVRWQHPERGLIPPAQFVPVLEESGRVQDLDLYVFEEVCRWLFERQQANKPMFPVSVNLSRLHFWKDNFIQDYVDVANAYQVDRKYLEFEITETAFMEDSKLIKVKEGIARMHENGFKCSVDDFGVGYSSLSLVSDMDVDALKFDRSFFTNLEDEKAQKIVRSLINMANELQLGIVLEGIETQAQINFLKGLRCDVIQGFYFSKPLPEDTFNKWVEEHS